ncbi:hypothetical protein D3C84_1064660 [compost metagenome]
MSNKTPATGAIIPLTIPPGSIIRPEENAVNISGPCKYKGSNVSVENNVIIITSISTVTSENMGNLNARMSITGLFSINCRQAKITIPRTPTATIQ